MTTTTPKRHIPYASCVADILLKGDWELFTVKYNHEANIDCMCCGHKHLRYNYWIVRADLSEEEIRVYQSGTFKKIQQSKQFKNKNPFLHNETYVSTGMVDEHDKWLCVGSECVVHIIKDEATINIMKGVEALANKIDRRWKDRLLRIQMKEYMEKNEKRFTLRQETVTNNAEAKAKALGQYYNTYGARREKRFFTAIIRQIDYWNPTNTRKIINDQLRSIGYPKSVLVKTANLSDKDRKEMIDEKEKQMQVFITGKRGLIYGKYTDVVWCDICLEHVPKQHSHDGVNL